MNKKEVEKMLGTKLEKHLKTKFNQKFSSIEQVKILEIDIDKNGDFLNDVYNIFLIYGYKVKETVKIRIIRNTVYKVSGVVTIDMVNDIDEVLNDLKKIIEG